MTKSAAAVLAAILGAAVALPADAGTVSATMTVSVTVVAPDAPRRAEPVRSDAEATQAAAAAAEPVAVVEDRATGTRIIVY